MEHTKSLEGSLTIETKRGRALIESKPGTILFDAEPQHEGARFAHLWHIDDVLLSLSVVEADTLWIKSLPSPEDENAWLDVTMIMREEGKIYRGKAFVFNVKYENIDRGNHVTLRGATPLEVEEF